MPVRLRYILLASLILTISSAGLSQAASSAVAQDQQQWLLERLRTSQALERDDLVFDALIRLELLAPDHSEVILTRLSHELQAGNIAAAEQRLNALREKPTEEKLLNQAETLMRLHSPEGQQTLQQARLLTAAGQTEQGLNHYQSLFGSEPPDFLLAVEYWSAVSAVTRQRSNAIKQLQALDQLYPGNHRLRLLLSRLLLSEDRTTEALSTLHSLATVPQASNSAAELEYDYLSWQPVGQATAYSLQAFIERYPSSPLRAAAFANLQQQQALIADPAWQAGERGKALLSQGDYAAAEPLLRRAIQRYPNDGNLHGSLAHALMSTGHYTEADTTFSTALSYLAASLQQEHINAIPLNQSEAGAWLAKWEDLKNYNNSLMQRQRGDAALAAGNYETARQAYQHARQLKPDHVEGLFGLANVELAQGNDQAAEQWLLQAQKQQPGDARLVYAMVNFYRARSPEQALQVIDHLPASQRAQYDDLRTSLVLERLYAQADQALARKDAYQAIALLGQAAKLAPESPWTTYRLANLLIEQGRIAEADEQFEALLQSQDSNPEARYAHGLYQASLQRDEAVHTTLAQIPLKDWNESMHTLAERVTRRQRLAQAQTLYDSGRRDQARALILANPTTADLTTLANWHYLSGDFSDAERYFQQAHTLEPDDPDALLGLAETRIALNQGSSARPLLEQLRMPEDSTSNYRRRYANAWAATGEPDKALQLLDELIDMGQADALVYRDASRLSAPQSPQRALDLSVLGMAAAGLLPAEAAAPRDDRQMTAASRIKDDDDWLSNSLRSDVDRLYQQQNPTVHLQHDFGWRSDSEASGLSNLKRQTTLLRVDIPLNQGRGFVQAEQVDLNVSTPGANSLFGGCNYVNEDCNPGSQSTSGTGVAIGWSDERWAWDIGRSPQGFELSNWLGGLTYNSDWRTLGYSLTLSRRPMSNTVVSYAGVVDPVTRTSWGGVTGNGLTLGLSHDQGGVDGLWANLAFHQLQGKNVPNNQRLTAMTGYYYRLRDHTDERMRTGLTLMYWGYDEGQDEYTLGQGGYYSPQRYFSVGIPFSYAWRNHSWSLAFESSVSWSNSRYSGGDRLYLGGMDERVAQAGFIPSADTARTNKSSSNSGVGVRLRSLAERRLSDHLVLGGGLDWGYSQDYSPSQAFMYLRYTFKPWQGNLPLPVQPLSPYADWR